MSDPTTPETPPAPNAVALPPELYKVVRQTLGGLPYDQVRPLLEQIDRSARLLTIPDAKPKDEEVPEDKTE